MRFKYNSSRTISSIGKESITPRNFIHATGSKMSAPLRCRKNCSSYDECGACVFCTEYHNQAKMQKALLMHDKFRIPTIGYAGSFFDLSVSMIQCVDGLLSSRRPIQFLLCICTFIKNITNLDYCDIFLKFYNVIYHIFTLVFPNYKSIMKYWPSGKIIDDDVELHATAFSDPVAQSFFDGLHKAGVKRNTFVKSDFVARLGNFCGMVLALPVFAKHDIDLTQIGFTQAFERKRKKMFQYDHILQLMDMIMMETKYFIEKIAIAVEHGDIGYILYDDEERRAYDLKFDFLNYYFTRNELALVDSAVFDNGKEKINCNLEWYYTETDLLIEFNEKLSTSCEDPAVKKDLKWQHSQIVKMNRAVGDLLRVYSERKEPFAVILYAPPATGKTAFGEHSLHIMFQNAISLKILSEPYHPKMKYHMNPRDDFFSAFRTSALVTWLDDVDQFRPAITEQMKGGAIAHSVEMVNTVPLSTNQAGLNEKGKVFFKCPFVIGTTNSRHAGIPSVFQDGAGALRRFLFVDPVVKEQYCKPGTKQLQGCNNPNVIDMWDIRIRRYVNVGSVYNEQFLVSYKPELKWTNGSGQAGVFNMKDYQKILYILQRAQRDTNEIAKKSTEIFRETRNCSVCHCLEMWCECEDTDVEDNNEAVATMKMSQFDTNDPLVACFMRTYGIEGVLKMGVNELKYRSSQSKHFTKNVNKYYVAAGVAGVLTGLVIVNKIIKSVASMFGADNGSVSATGQTQSSPWVFDGQHVTNIKTTPVGVDLDNMRRILTRNCCFAGYRDGKGNMISMNMLGLYGCVAVVPKHFFYDAFPWLFKNGDFNYNTGINLYVIRGNTNTPLTLNNKFLIDNSCLTDADGDFLFITHPNLGPFKDIRHYFVDEPVKGKLDCLAIIRNDVGELREENINACEFKESISYKLDAFENAGSITTNVYGGHFKTDMSRGVCGSPYFTQLPNKRVVILGIQVATHDYKKKSYCQVIFKNQIPNCELNSLPDKIDLQSFYSTDMNLEIKPDLHPKDPLRQFTGVLDVLGTLEGPRAKLKTKVGPTLMSKDVIKFYNLDGPTHFSPKNVSSRECILNNYKHVTDKSDIPPRLIKQASDAIIEWYYRVIIQYKLEVPNKPYSMDIGINGIDGVQYVDRLVGHTSAGFAHRGRKDELFIEIQSDDYHQVKYDVKDEIKLEINKLIMSYEKGERSAVVADYCFKDEPIKMKKVVANDVRLFNSMPLSFNILFRMYFLPFVPLFSGKHRHLFGHAVGCNPFSKSWEYLYRHLIKFGLDRIIAGDWKKFDKKMVAIVLTHAFAILKELARRFGWSERDLMIMQGLITDLVYCVVNVFNTIVMLSGNNPSGQPFTTIINGNANLIYLMCIFIVLAEENNCTNYDLSRWTDFVSSLVYGDDNIMGVSNKYPWYNHTNMARVASTFGLEYTMADKNSVSVPYIHIKNAEFLKRKFVVRKGFVYAPLAVESIIKSLHMCTESRNITPKQQCAEIIYSANMEFFQYGRKRFTHEHAFLNRILDKYDLRNYIKDGKLPDFNDFLNRFSITATRLKQKENISVFDNVDDSLIALLEELNDSDWDDETTVFDPNHGYLEDEFNEFTLEDAASMTAEIQVEMEEVNETLDEMDRYVLAFSDHSNIIYQREFEIRRLADLRFRELEEAARLARIQYFRNQGNQMGYYFNIRNTDNDDDNMHATVQLDRDVHKLVPAKRPVKGLKLLLRSYIPISSIMYIKIPKIKCVDTLKCPGCLPCYGSKQDDTVIHGDQYGPILIHHCVNKKRRLMSLDEGPIHATAERASEAPVTAHETTVQFSEEPQVTHLSYEHGISASQVGDGQQSDAAIEKFLSRPILIYRLEWLVGNTTLPAPHTISPWSRFLLNSQVREKIARFKLLRGTLKIRIMVNGSPFHYGRLFVGLKPGRTNSTNNTINLDPADSVTTNNYYNGVPPLAWEVNRTLYSQRPHVLINPNTNAVAEITWPMFINTPWIDVANIAYDSSLMGQLEIWELNFLQHAANATNATLNVSFFAWMEDIVLSGATPNATATMRKTRAKGPSKGDEYNNNGVVSMPATALATFANKFTDYSFIGPYARATEIGANAVGSIAKIFGWSKPNVVDKEIITHTIQGGRFPNTMGTSPLVKLSLDPKQEVSVDPGLLDLPRCDEMSFSYISQIEGLVYQELITNTDLNHIVGFALTPSLAPDFDSGTKTYGAQTPVAFISAPFQNWRGSLVVRFQFVVSKVHRGRFLLVYTPEANCTLPLTTETLLINSHFNEVIDLSEDTDVSYEIKWNQSAAYRQFSSPTNQRMLNSGGTDLTFPDRYCNGRLDLYVLNNLAIASNEDTSAYVNIYLRAGDDYTVSNPSASLPNFSYSDVGGTFPLTATAGVDPAFTSTDQEDLSNQTIAKVINPLDSEIGANELYAAYMGEQCHSIRAICKRMVGYFPFSRISPGAAGAITLNSWILPFVPIGRAGGSYGTSGLDQFEEIANVWMTPVRWFAQGFVGYRGGMRYAVVTASTYQRTLWRVFRRDFPVKNISFKTYAIVNNSVENYVDLMGWQVGHNEMTDFYAMAGMQPSSSQDNTMVTIELPWYSGYRFAYIHDVSDPSVTGYETAENSFHKSWVASLDVPAGHGNNSMNVMGRFYTGAAEDTQFHFFIGAPPYYYRVRFSSDQESGVVPP